MNNIITNTLFSAPIYWGFAQLPHIQKISLGLMVLSYGKQLAWDYDPAISRKRKVMHWIAGGTLIAGAMASMIYGGYYLYLLSQRVPLSRSMVFGQNPGIASEKDPYEKAYEWHYQQSERKGPIEKLISSSSVCKEKILYLVSSEESDQNGALNPLKEWERFFNLKGSLPYCLRQYSDLIYKSIRHPLQICEQIQAAKEQKIQDLFIETHGNRFALGLSKSSLFKVFDVLPQNCFDGLASNARIFLVSCRNAENGYWQPNIAQWISWISNRQVIASSDSVGNRYALNLLDNRVDVSFDGAELHSIHLSQSWADMGMFFAQTITAGVVGALIIRQMFQLGHSIYRRFSVKHN